MENVLSKQKALPWHWSQNISKGTSFTLNAKGLHVWLVLHFSEFHYRL